MKIFAFASWLYATFIILVGLTIKIVLYKLVKRPWASKIASWFIRLLIFTPVRSHGAIDPETRIFLINHQSDLDIGVMETLTGMDLVWVAKKELFEIPFFGLAVRLSKDIPVERESKSSLIKPGAKMLADKYSLRVQPVVLLETAQHFDVKKRHFKPGTVHAFFLDSFTAEKENKEWLNDLQVTMQRVYDEELAKLHS